MVFWQQNHQRKIGIVMIKNLLSFILFCLFFAPVSLPVSLPASLSASPLASDNAETKKRPNIILILADDLGYTDLGSYGSEIATPAIDSLAQSGMRFSNYHSAANCSPARAMLMTGVNNHRAGVGNIRETRPDPTRTMPAYDGVLSHQTVTIATLLQDSGYNTYMAGKWHLGQTPDKLPYNRGFHRTFSLGDSGADNWEDRPYIPLYDQANWYADGQPADLPEDFYSSEFLTDKMIEFIESGRESGKPFFGYLPFQAVHIPVQAPQEFIDRYMGTYDGGWHELRRNRLEGAIANGIVPAGTQMVEMSSTRDWDSMSHADKRYQAKRMAVYAAMVEAMDHHIGRLIAYLKSTGQYENTIFIFTSDNGTHSSGQHDQESSFMSRNNNARMGYTSDYETLGLKGSYNALPLSFASASASPLSYYKFYTAEGGMRVPLIISGIPDGVKGAVTDSFSFATDITPTILDLTGTKAPMDIYAGRRIEPITGESLTAVLTGSADTSYADDKPVAYELAGHSALFMGDFKITRVRAPMGDNQWHLYNIVTDPGEVTDLQAEMPGRFQRMLGHYEIWAQSAGVYDVPDGYSSHIRQIALNSIVEGRLAFFTFLILLLVLCPFYVYWRIKGRH